MSIWAARGWLGRLAVVWVPLSEGCFTGRFGDLGLVRRVSQATQVIRSADVICMCYDPTWDVFLSHPRRPAVHVVPGSAYPGAFHVGVHGSVDVFLVSPHVSRTFYSDMYCRISVLGFHLCF